MISNDQKFKRAPWNILDFILLTVMAAIMIFSIVFKVGTGD